MRNAKLFVKGLHKYKSSSSKINCSIEPGIHEVYHMVQDSCKKFISCKYRKYNFDSKAYCIDDTIFVNPKTSKRVCRYWKGAVTLNNYKSCTVENNTHSIMSKEI